VRAPAVLLALGACLGACAGSPPPAATEPDPAHLAAADAPPPVPTISPTEAHEPAPTPPSHEARERRVIELLEGRVPDSELKLDSGGGW
jgi:hypothetical protein